MNRSDGLGTRSVGRGFNERPLSVPTSGDPVKGSNRPFGFGGCARFRRITRATGSHVRPKIENARGNKTETAPRRPSDRPRALERLSAHSAIVRSGVVVRTVVERRVDDPGVTLERLRETSFVPAYPVISRPERSPASRVRVRRDNRFAIERNGVRSAERIHDATIANARFRRATDRRRRTSPPRLHRPWCGTVSGVRDSTDVESDETALTSPSHAVYTFFNGDGDVAYNAHVACRAKNRSGPEIQCVHVRGSCRRPGRAGSHGTDGRRENRTCPRRPSRDPRRPTDVLLGQSTNRYDRVRIHERNVFGFRFTRSDVFGRQTYCS